MHLAVIAQVLTVDVRSKVNLADVVVAKHRGVSCVWGVVGGAVVDGAASGEGQARLQSVLFDQPPGAVLQLLTARDTNQHERTSEDKSNGTINNP